MRKKPGSLRLLRKNAYSLPFVFPWQPGVNVMLKINLLPLTRTQRAILWCKGVPGAICWIPAMLFWGPVLVIVYLALKGYEVAYPCGCALGRRLLGVQRRVSMEEAMEIARQVVGGEGRRCTMSLGDRVGPVLTDDRRRAEALRWRRYAPKAR